MAKKKRKKVGAPPGSLVYTGDKPLDRTRVQLTEFDGDQIKESTGHDEIPPIEKENLIHWYDLRGLHNVSVIEKLGRTYDIHPLALEDILDTAQRPKYEEFPNGFFLILHAVEWDADKTRLRKEQVALFCGENLLISFQEFTTDVFAPIRERLRNARGKIRLRGADYLAYALTDTLVDNYLHVLDRIQEEIEILEDEVNTRPSPQIKDKIHRIKRAVLEFRRLCTPMREAILRFQRDENPFIKDQTPIFLRDLVDHIIQVTDSIDTYRDMLNSLQDLSLAELSYRMNNVIQVLTIISTIFIPLTFLVGVYGMNFDHMPELHWRYGYYVVWAIMVVISILLVIFFRHKRWL